MQGQSRYYRLLVARVWRQPGQDSSSSSCSNGPALRGISTSEPTFGSAHKAASGNESQFHDKVEKYSAYQPTPVSIAHFMDFGKSATLETSCLFLKREVPVRLANIMKELLIMPKELRLTMACKVIVEQYAKSFNDIIAYENADFKKPRVMQEFTQTLLDIRERHADTVQTMAEAVMEVRQDFPKHKGSQNLPKFGKNIQYFLDRLYTSRISTRMLINQHALLFSETKGQRKDTKDGFKQTMVGSIDPECEVGMVVLQAYENAKLLCDKYYMASPDLVYEAFDGTASSSKEPSGVSAGAVIGTVGKKNIGRQDKINFVYIPSHLDHILFELFKNAMRATIENAGESAVHLPPIEVFTVKGKGDLAIRISDRGGGIPRRFIHNIFEYLYTTANPVITSSTDMHEMELINDATVPLAGYGYGLPLSRLYARYFGGDLEIYSYEGWGTDAVVYLNALAKDAKERLPVYHETGTKKIYEAQLTASDWTIQPHRSQ